MHERTTDEEDTLAKDLYLGPSYFTWTQLASMSQQIIDVHATGARRILEIGKGTGFVSDYLRKAGREVVTFDINPNLEPDVLGSVLELEKHFAAGSFDCVLCAEVLEHLPFSDFRPALGQIEKVCRKSFILTLPRFQRVLVDWQMRLKLPRLHYKTLGVFLAYRSSRKRIYSGHHWEINSDPETRLAHVRRVVGEYFEIRRDHRLRWNPYHHFFHLQTREGVPNNVKEFE